MNKQITFLMLACFLMGACSKSSDSTPDEPSKKTLMTVEAILTPYKFGQPSSSDKFTWAKQYFDGQGRLTQYDSRTGIDRYDATKSYLNTTTFIYSGDKLSEKKNSSFRFVYKYNSLGDTSEIQKFASTGLWETEIRDYSQDRKLLQASFYMDNELRRKEVYSYQDGNVVTNSIYYRPFINSNKLIWNLDQRGNILKETYINTEKNTSTIQILADYKYNTSGQISQQIKNTYYTIEFTKWINSYDGAGVLLKQIVSKSNSFDGTYSDIAAIDYHYTYK